MHDPKDDLSAAQDSQEEKISPEVKSHVTKVTQQIDGYLKDATSENIKLYVRDGLLSVQDILSVHGEYRAWANHSPMPSA